MVSSCFAVHVLRRSPHTRSFPSFTPVRVRSPLAVRAGIRLRDHSCSKLLLCPVSYWWPQACWPLAVWRTPNPAWPRRRSIQVSTPARRSRTGRMAQSCRPYPTSPLMTASSRRSATWAICIRASPVRIIPDCATISKAQVETLQEFLPKLLKNSFRNRSKAWSVSGGEVVKKSGPTHFPLYLFYLP